MGIADRRYISPKISKFPGYVLLAQFDIKVVDLLTIETAENFKLFHSFVL